jgi:four helix bundle protein
MPQFLQIEDLQVYQMLVDLHIEISDLSLNWPSFEKFELAAQVRRASNSAPANLAEKHSDRHVRNKIEGVNRSRTEALEVVHHLYVAQRKKYITEEVYQHYKERYQRCVRMLNGLERTLERQLPEESRRFPATSKTGNSDSRTPNPEP